MPTLVNHNNRFIKSKLMYPITNKNYLDDKFTREEWNALKRYLQQAYALTIFGYGAPTTDVEAMKLLRDAWNENQLKKDFRENIEIIDIKQREELLNTWVGFSTSWSPRVSDSIYDSCILKYPRESCETLHLMHYGVQLPEREFGRNSPIWAAKTIQELKKLADSLLNI